MYRYRYSFARFCFANKQNEENEFTIDDRSPHRTSLLSIERDPSESLVIPRFNTRPKEYSRRHHHTFMMKLPTILQLLLIRAVVVEAASSTSSSNSCSLQLWAYSTFNCSPPGPPNARGTIIADNQCRTVQSSSTVDYELLPGNYRAVCTPSGQLHFLESGCTSSTCSAAIASNSICDQNLTATASLYSSWNAPEYLVKPLVPGYTCLSLNDAQGNANALTIVVFGNCSAANGCTVVNDVTTSPTPAATPTPKPTRPPVAVVSPPTTTASNATLAPSTAAAASAPSTTNGTAAAGIGSGSSTTTTTTTKGGQVGSGIIAGVIVGLVVGAAIAFFFVYTSARRRRKKASGSHKSNADGATNAEESPVSQGSEGLRLQQQQRWANEIIIDPSADDVSTLGGSVLGGLNLMENGSVHHPGDEPTASVHLDYDYAAAAAGGDPYRSSGDERSRSVADHTFTSYSHAGGGGGGTTMLGQSVFADDMSFEQQYADGGDNDDNNNNNANTTTNNNALNEARPFVVKAPPGKLGMVVDTPHGGVPVVRAIKPDSVLAAKVQIGDRLIAVDNLDVSRMTAVEVSNLISVKQHRMRLLTFCRMPNEP